MRIEGGGEKRALRHLLLCGTQNRNAQPYRGLNKRRWVYPDPLGLSPGRLTEARFASTEPGVLAVRGKDS